MAQVNSPFPTGPLGPVLGQPPMAPGLPQQPQQPSFASIFGGASPWQPSVTAGQNGQPTSFASPGQPNPNYVTSAAAQQIAKLFGANAVEQNRNGMASPGSPAPSQPIYGLDFGRGDVQGADVAATGLQRGDSPDQIAERYRAGLNTKAWAGDIPVPQANPTDNTFFNRTTPVSTNTSTPGQAQFFAPQAQPNVAPVTGGSLGGGSLGQYAALLQQLFAGGQQMPGAAFWGGGR